MKQHISDEPLCLMPRCFVLVGGGARKPDEHARPPLGIIGTQQAGDDGESLATHEHIIVIASSGKQRQMSLAYAGVLHTKFSKYLTYRQ